MRAVVYRGPLDLVLQDVPEPALAPGDVRIRVESAGVCGTDVRIYKGEHSAYAGIAGRVPGHEIVGRIAEMTDSGRPEGLAEGARVFVAPNMGCGRCEQCRRGNENLCPTTDGIGITLDGAFAQSLIVPARAVQRGNLIGLGESANGDTAVLIEPLACVLRGQEKVDVRAGDTVLVGGAGPVGLLHVALAVSRGASKVICAARSATRRAAAEQAGATVVIDADRSELSEAVPALTGGRGADVVITAAPVHAMQTAAIQVAAVGGRVLFFGGLPKSRPLVELDSNAIHYKELIVTGTTASTLDDCRQAAALVRDGRLQLDWLVSDVYPLGHFADAIGRVQDSSALKVVVRPQAVDQETGASDGR